MVVKRSTGVRNIRQGLKVLELLVHQLLFNQTSTAWDNHTNRNRILRSDTLFSVTAQLLVGFIYRHMVLEKMQMQDVELHYYTRPAAVIIKTS